jgi:hypothetical protein
MKNFSKLYGFLKNYPDELSEYIRLSNSYYFPELFKIAQQIGQKNMFGETVEKEEPISFLLSANTLGISESDAKILDLIFDRLKAANPYVPEKELFGDLRKDFLSNRYGYRYRYLDSIFSYDKNALEKYLKLFPDLRWSPEFQQIPLPFGDAEEIRPLGESLGNAIYDQERIQKAYDMIVANPEAKALADNLWKGSGKYLYINNPKKEVLENILKDMGIDIFDSSFYFNLRKFYENNAKYSYDPILKEDVDKEKVEIEDLWKKLKLLNIEAKRIKESINPGEFIPKQESEIMNIRDSLLSSAQYAIFIVKKISYDNMSFEPFKYLNLNRNSFDGDIDNIKDILERQTISRDPINDAGEKKRIIISEIEKSESIINNYKKYLGVFKRLDKNFADELLKQFDQINNEDKKLIAWVEKNRIDIIRNNYLISLKMIASDVASEAEKYNNIDFDKNSFYSGIRAILYRESRNQKQLIGGLINLIGKQIGYIGSYIMKNISEKAKISLFNKAKDLFESLYFEFPFYTNDTIKNSFYLYRKDITFEYDKVIKFINEYNGKPNIKSYLNVFSNISKDKELLDKYLKTVLKEDIFNSILFGVNDFNIDKKILNIINNSKIKDEEKLINFITENLVEDAFDILKKYIADKIFYRFSDKQLLSNFYGEIDLYSSKAAIIAPVASSNLFKDIILSSNRDSPFSGYTKMDPSLSLTRIMNKLRTLFANKDSILTDDNLANKILEEIDKNGQDDKFKAINNILDLISTELSAGNISLPESFTERINNIVTLPILNGSTFAFKSGKDIGKVCRVLDRESFNRIKYLSPDGKIETATFTDIYRAIHVLSPTLQDFYNSISSLKQKNNIPNFELVMSEPYDSIINKLKLLLKEMNIEWNKVYEDMSETNIYKNIIFQYNISSFNKENFVETIRKATKEVKEIEAVNLFTRRSNLLAETFGSIGFKDISLSIDNILSKNKLEFLPKKEIVSKILGLVNSSFNPGNEETSYISSFINSIESKKFENFVVPIIKKLKIINFTIITKVCYQVNNYKRNYNKEDLERVLKILNLEGMEVSSAVEKILGASAYLHNNAAISDRYARSMIRSPNFYSDSQISMEYIDSCTRLFIYGGIDAIKDKNSSVYKTIQKMNLAKLISDIDEFVSVLDSFSKLCMKKDGIRSNLGNPTADIKLDDLLNKIVNSNNLPEDNSIDINMEKYIIGWESLSFEGRVEKLKEYVSISSTNNIDNDPVINAISNYVYTDDFDKKIEIIKKSASDKKQYLKDIKIKSIIQKASSYLKMIDTSSTIIEYAMLAKKKDERLFNFEYTHHDNSFRFRVLRDMDPEHFTVGADTNCCQRIHGIGHNSAVDSYINPLAGVLLLEGSINGKWNILSQSYFHYVPRNNGVILDNVEINNSNIYSFTKNKNYNLESIYACFSTFIKNKYNLSYVVCGMKHNKLNNSMFIKSSMDGDDPRHFEFKKYSDFKVSRHLNLLRPKFNLVLIPEERIQNK